MNFQKFLGICFGVLLALQVKAAQFDVIECPDQLRVRGTFVHNDQVFTMRNTESTDRDYYRQIFGDPTTMEKYMQGVPRPEEEIERRHLKYLGWWKDNNPWSSYLVFNAAQKFVGHVLLEDGDRDNPKESELSYVLRSEYWRQGIGTASVKAVLDGVVPLIAPRFQIKEHDIVQIFATARPDNPGSVGVLTNNGFSLEYEEEKFGAVRQFYTKRIE